MSIPAFRTLQRVFLFLLLLGVSAVSLTAGENAEKILKKLQESYNKINDLSAEFTQHIQFGGTKLEESFEGTIRMKKGNNYRIETEDQTIVIDGASVWSYSNQTNQVLVDIYREDPRTFSPDKVLATAPEQFAPALLADEKLDGADVAVLKLLPRTGQPHLKWMKVWVDRKGWIMKKVQILDASDNLTTYTITRLKLNSGLPPSTFIFEAPKGVEVIDLR